MALTLAQRDRVFNILLGEHATSAGPVDYPKLCRKLFDLIFASNTEKEIQLRALLKKHRDNAVDAVDTYDAAAAAAKQRMEEVRDELVTLHDAV